MRIWFIKTTTTLSVTVISIQCTWRQSNKWTISSSTKQTSFSILTHTMRCLGGHLKDSQDHHRNFSEFYNSIIKTAKCQNALRLRSNVNGTYPSGECWPRGNSLAEVSQDSDDDHAGLKTIGSSLWCNKVRFMEWPSVIRDGPNTLISFIVEAPNTTVHNGSLSMVRFAYKP